MVERALIQINFSTILSFSSMVTLTSLWELTIYSLGSLRPLNTSFLWAIPRVKCTLPLGDPEIKLRRQTRLILRST
jgi:hypothetical protein